jgi:hypothetical protein
MITNATIDVLIICNDLNPYLEPLIDTGQMELRVVSIDEKCGWGEK